MKILHLFSNWKWTGPAEPALNLALMLARRGHQISFMCGRTPKGEPEFLANMARQRGLYPDTRLILKKHLNVSSNLIDLVVLKKLLRRENYDIIHSHLTNDHLLAGLAAGYARRKCPIIRTCYNGEPAKTDWRDKILYNKFSDGLITVSNKMRDSILKNYSLGPDRVWKIDTGVDLERFNPQSVSNDYRARFGIGSKDIVVGIVARVQKHRRFEVLLQAIKIATEKMPGLKLMIVGRGTYMNELAVQPAKDLGLSNNIVFTGYRKDDYVETLACMDMKVFLVPGSDGSCRAVREAMAMGKPIITARRGILPEIVKTGIDGLVIDDTPVNLADAVLQLATDEDMRKKMGRAAAIKAQKVFSIISQAGAIEKVYQLCLEKNHAPTAA